MEFERQMSERARELAPCPEGLCQACAWTGIDPERLSEGINGEYIVLAFQALPPIREKDIHGVPI